MFGSFILLHVVTYMEIQKSFTVIIKKIAPARHVRDLLFFLKCFLSPIYKQLSFGHDFFLKKGDVEMEENSLEREAVQWLKLEVWTEKVGRVSCILLRICSVTLGSLGLSGLSPVKSKFLKSSCSLNFLN